MIPLVPALVAAVALGAPSAPPNLAAGKPVVFAPLPNYRLTAKGDTDTKDLTDGRFSTRPDHHMWFEPQCVGYSYGGQCNLAVDLGVRRAIDAVEMRWQGGSPQAGVSFPVWVRVLVSDDGKRYFPVAEYSRFKPGDNVRFGVPRDDGTAWIFPLRFSGLHAAGRYVGVSFYGAALSVTDELTIIGGGDGLKTFHPAPESADLFTVTGAQPYFHKPELWVTREFTTPNPIGLIVGVSPPAAKAAFVLDLPPGIRLRGGSVAGVDLASLTPTPVAGGFSRFVVPVGTLRQGALPRATKTWGRLFLQSDLPDGQHTALRYGLRWENGPLRLVRQPLRSVTCPRTPTPKRLTTTLGWWPLDGTRNWPDGLTAARRLGLNTIPAFAHWTHFDDPAVARFLEQARAQGFKLLNVDSPWHRMLAKHKGDKELFCQFADGTTGNRLCPSYRGPAYREELARVAKETAALRADMLTADVELWSWAGPKDCRKCTRCQADFKQSGLATWEQWKLQKGYEMWRDLADTVRTAMKGVGKPDLELGAYDFRPGMNYQQFWPFDRLYPKLLQDSEVSTYTPLYPYHLALIGNEVRQDRQRLGRSDVLPWITPGDAGVFPGEAFYHALLECYANGARGVYYWSSRVWDAEDMVAQARAIRVVAQVEQVIVDGDLIRGVKSTPSIRLSGMRRGSEWFLLPADYFGEVDTPVRLTIPVKVPSRITDLETGRTLGTVTPAAPNLTFSFGDRRAIPMLVQAT